MASKGGVLGNLEILAEIERGKIIVFPFNKERVQTTSIDVTLGSHYYRELGADGGRGHIRPEPVYQISTNNGNCAIYQGQDIWGSYHNALPFIDAVKELHTKTLNTPPLFLTFPTETFNPCDRQRFIILNPGENILAHTEEFIGSSSSDITTMCETKSTFGRMLGETCKCAGWGDVGYFSRWTLEITNNSIHALLLRVGEPIAQIVFLRVEGCDPSTTYTQKGRYQQGNSLEELQKSWHPNMMLPKFRNKNVLKIEEDKVSFKEPTKSAYGNWEEHKMTLRNIGFEESDTPHKVHPEGSNAVVSALYQAGADVAYRNAFFNQ